MSVESAAGVVCVRWLKWSDEKIEKEWSKFAGYPDSCDFWILSCWKNHAFKVLQSQRFVGHSLVAELNLNGFELIPRCSKERVQIIE